MFLQVRESDIISKLTILDASICEKMCILFEQELWTRIANKNREQES